MTYTNGASWDTVSAQYAFFDCLHSTTYTLSGGVYEGGWKGGKREGQCTYTYPDGLCVVRSVFLDYTHTLSGGVYEGDYENGVRHGHGKYTLSDGAPSDVYSLKD